MKIAIDISQIAYEGTGVAEYTREMVRSLLEIDKENEYILFGISFRRRKILQSHFNSVKYLSDKVSLKLFPIPQTVGNFLWNRLHIVNIEKLIGKVDIFHSSDWIQPPTLAKKVTTVHDLVVYKYPQTSHPNIIETQKRRLFWVKKECDLIFADSMATKNDLVKILKFNHKKIKVVYAGVSNIFKPVSEKEIERVRRKYDLQGEYILAVGTQEPRKNTQNVLRAFEQFSQHALIAARKRPIKLVIVGKLGWGEKIRQSKYVRVLGFVDRKDLPGLYSTASVFVYPSLYEGFGLPVAEAMKCGCVVVTSDRGSLKEIAGEAAILVDPQDSRDISTKLIRFFINKDVGKSYMEKGEKHAAKFTWKKSAGEILRLYRRLYTLSFRRQHYVSTFQTG